MNSVLKSILKDLSQRPEVEAIALAGSRTTGRFDAESDTDVYIYLNQPLGIPARRELLEGRCSVLELDNRFWETEDNGVTTEGDPFDLIYRDFVSFEEQIRRATESHEASIGYSTCLWFNLLHSAILHDRQGQLRHLKDEAKRPYPEELRQAIIAKNWPLLQENLTGFLGQALKAARRGDLVSVQHRSAAFLASWADVLFALNHEPHPGEKRWAEWIERRCPLAPKGWRWFLAEAVKRTDEEGLGEALRGLRDGLGLLLADEGLI